MQQSSMMVASMTPSHMTSAKMMDNLPNGNANYCLTTMTEDYNQSSMMSNTDEYTYEQTSGGSFLSKKKMQYLEQKISDRSGSYCYAEDPTLYKKARKRLQNRESAFRSRLKKR